MRKPNEYQKVFELVKKVFVGDENKTIRWMYASNPLLGGFKPAQIIEVNPGKLLKIVTQQLAENAPPDPKKSDVSA